VKITRIEDSVFILKQILVRMTIYSSIGCIDILTDEQLPEDGIVRSKYIAIKYDFNDILK
jgi:hypothetical protein